jgi:type II secretory pathway component GspD/PulD (secretin)
MNKRYCFLILAILVLIQGLYGQRMKSMDFRNQDITDILMVMAEISGTSIITDETVGGSASFHFSDSDFEDSLEHFLSSYHLFYKKEGAVFRVSRIQAVLNRDTSLVTMRAREVEAESLIKTLARIWNTTILWDPLPRITLTVDIDGLPPEKALDIFIRRLAEFTLEKQDSYYYIRHTNPGGARKTAVREIDRSGETYSIGLESVRFLELLPELFKKAGKEYAILTKSDTVLENLYYTGKDFDSLLRIILDQGNADYTVHNNIYYIIELQRRDIVKKFRETRIIPLSYLHAQDLPAMLPAEIGAGNNIKVDKNTNAVIVTGTEEETAPIVSFIEKIDRPGESCPVTLKYIKTEDLLKTLPPSTAKEEILDSGFPNLIFYTGPREKRDLFLKELGIIDRPKPQIRYELLVIEYMKNKEARVNRSLVVSPAGESKDTSFMGNLSNVMSLSFDVVAQFGYQFAANLSVQLGENTAEVYANTTLNGLSGQEIKFQNTDTYRYQEFEADADTGNISRTGVTREITSGLIVALNGWVSGDDMITMSVNATVSKQNNNSAIDSTALPTTSERVVNTQIRTPSGKPVVLSGLMKEDTNKNIKKIPLLGDIPLLGRLFRDQVDTKEKTEIVIYIVPYLSRENISEEQDIASRFEQYYHSFVEGKFK